MELWQAIKFATRALSLVRTAGSSPEELERLQRKRLERIVRHARENSRFYAEKFKAIDGATFELSQLPPTDKAEMMDNFDDVLTVDDVDRAGVEQFFEDDANLGKLYKDKYVLSHTSGSTGQPLLLVKAQDDFDLMFALQAARGNCDELDLGEIVKRMASPVRLAAVTMQPGFYPSGTAFEYMPEGVRQYIDVLQVCLTEENLVEQLAEFRPTHLTTYASILHELARHAEAGKLSLKPELRQIVNISEPLMPPAKKRYSELFDAPILDDYAMGECLFLSNGCKTSGGMHINSDWAILENVDEDYQPVPTGEKGAKVLITNLANKVQPFIRYEVGDVVVMATEPCECDSNLPLVQEVRGRSSDVFWIGEGENLRAFHPAILQDALGQVTEAREHQLTQDQPGKIKVALEPISGAQVDSHAVQKVLDEHLAEYGIQKDLAVEVEVVERLAPDPESGKFKRVVSNYDPDES